MCGMDVFVCAELCPTLCDPMDCSGAPLSMEFSKQDYGVAIFSSWESSWSRDRTRGYSSGAEHLTAEIESVSLCLLHCRWILYQCAPCMYPNSFTFFFATQHGLWDLSSLTRDWTALGFPKISFLYASLCAKCYSLFGGYSSEQWLATTQDLLRVEHSVIIVAAITMIASTYVAFTVLVC